MTTQSNAAGKLPSVLLIEDAFNGELISSLLQDAGLSVWHSRDENDAATAVCCFNPDVMLVAFNDAGPDGPAIVAQLKASMPRLQNVPVIVMTESRMSALARRRLATLNVTWILEKPLVLTSLPKLVRATMRSSNADVVQSQRFVQQIEFGQSASSALMRCVV